MKMRHPKTIHDVSSLLQDSIIGAGSVVTNNVDDNTIVAGNPAKYIQKTQGYR